MQPIEHPCVWTADSEAVARSLNIQLSESQKSALTGLAHGDVTADSSGSVHHEVLTQLASDLQHQLEHGTGAVLLKGLDVSDLTEEDARGILLRFGSMLGTPVSQSPAGERIFSVRDAGFAENDPRARGPNTTRRLTFHSDRCDVIGFLCVKQAMSGGRNDIVSSAAVFNRLLRSRPDLVRVLMEPFYYKRHSVDTANQRAWCRQPIFSFTSGYFACNLLRVLIDRAAAMPELPDLTAIQKEALDAVEDTAAEPGMHVSVTQCPGDLLLLNNWVTLHRRTAFTDHPEPDLRRHILRIWLSVPNSRPLDPLFRDNYGAVEAGALRGGMTAS